MRRRCMVLPAEKPEVVQASPTVFERYKWAWPILIGTLIGIGLRVSFFGNPGDPFNAMMASFAMLAPLVIGAVTVVSAERVARRTWWYYFWAASSANALCAVIALLVTIEGIICIFLAVPLFVLLGGISGLITGFLCRLVIKPSGSLYAIAVVPLLLGGLEQHLPLPQSILSEERVLFIPAPKEVVWHQLMTARDIQPTEMNEAWMYRIGVPLPESAVTEQRDGSLVRHIVMGKSIHFDQVAVEWIPEYRVRWQNRFTDDSFPPGALDDHVRIGGTYFDVLDTEYTLTAVHGGTQLRAILHYRVSTNFNWYVQPIASFLVGNFEEAALRFYGRRAELVAPTG